MPGTAIDRARHLLAGERGVGRGLEATKLKRLVNSKTRILSLCAIM